MASLIPGFEYDVFISYRQKDNKHEGWVSEFVEQLKGELESTFKEEISVYFDINPHDGLLETHDVDDSLKEKLKCLVFIPIISRTYCDPKSFAWEHELKAFIDQASKDQYGVKVILQNGNVASRVLPVRIHELDMHDTRLCETTLGGVLRGVEFIYKSPGVNRPLRANEDHPKDNLNRTYYRDQINKVANAIDQIIQSMKYGKSYREKKSGDSWKKLIIDQRRAEWTKRQLFNLKTKKRLISTLLVLICLICIFLGYKYVYQPGKEKIFAFVALQNPDNDSVLNVDNDNLIEAVYNKLEGIRGISTISRMLMDQHTTEESLNTLIKDLKPDYIMGSRFRKEGNSVFLWIEMSSVKDKKRIWSNEYSWNRNYISKISQEVTRIIVEKLKKHITASEVNLIETEPTKSPEALYSFTYGNRASEDGQIAYLTGNRMLTSNSIKLALQLYDEAIRFDPAFAKAYARRAIARSWGFNMGQLDSTHIEKCFADIKKAQALINNLPEVENAWGFYYYYCRNEYRAAIDHFKKASELEPGKYEALFYMALVYRKMGDWDKSQQLMRQVIKLKPKESLYLTNIGLSYTYLHNYDSAIIYHQLAIDAMPGWAAPYNNQIETLILKYGNTNASWSVLDTAVKKTADNMVEWRILMLIYDKKFNEALNIAENTIPADFKISGDKYLYLARIYQLLNNPVMAGKYIDSSLVSYNYNLKSNYSNYKIHGSLGIAYALMGNSEKALEEGNIAMEVARKNILEEIDSRINLAKIYTIVGDYYNAFMSIENLLKNPACLSVKLLQVDPIWQPLYGRPEYFVLIKKFQKN